MLDLSPSDATQKLIERAHALMDELVYPLEPAARRSFEEALPAIEQARRKAREAGMWAPHMPEELGGMGLGFLPHAQLSEVFGRSPLGHYIFGCPAPDAGNQELLLHHGSEAQKQRFLAPLVRGEARSCFGMTEPERPGSNPTWLESRAERDGEHYVLTGHKWFTTAAHQADICIVMAVTNPDGPPHQRASQILVPCDTPGFVHVRRISIMGEEGFGWASHSEVRFEGCRVPAENLLGVEGEGFRLAQERLGPGRIHHCMRWLGICERAFEMMCDRSLSREIAPGRPLGSKQLVQAFIAESRAEIDAARLYVYATAAKIDQQGAKAARNEISCIKFHVAGVLSRVLDRAIQVHGALGMTDDTPLAWFYRHERAARIYDGPDEVHKVSVAERILRDRARVLSSAKA